MSNLSDKVPPHTLGAIQRYVKSHIPPGGFLTAVLSNNLTEAFCRADDQNTAAMRDIMAYLYMDMRSDCWGSKEKVHAWLNGNEEAI